ncbi:hypothetical protein [Parasitella parasitica]|uniref:Cytidyltransferase-like domain-containing protein n=1 Tax=Parasitella parasitica TaxID=35722 RepID=A0A0B7N7F9_9FUNG|nr:hypothetical protein [Parasitella parasitica]
MSTVLLPLNVKRLNALEKRQSSFIEEAVVLAIKRQTNLVISISCDEIKAHLDCIDAIWEQIQALLGAIYVIQLNTSYRLDRPLFNCNVVFADVCGYSVYLEPYIQTVCVSSENINDVQSSQWETYLLTNDSQTELEDDTDHMKPLVFQRNTGPIEPLIFNRVAVGGTFDHLHAGHKILLTMTALLAKQSMVVGVTDDCMLLKKKHRDLIASTQQRMENVKAYLQLVKRSITYDVVPIKDPFGPTVTDQNIDALVVSKETLKGGDLVNSERERRKYHPLKLRIIDVISSDNASIQGKDLTDLKISSSWIREYIAKNKIDNKE